MMEVKRTSACFVFMVSQAMVVCRITGITGITGITDISYSSSKYTHTKKSNVITRQKLTTLGSLYNLQCFIFFFIFCLQKKWDWIYTRAAELMQFFYCPHGSRDDLWGNEMGRISHYTITHLPATLSWICIFLKFRFHLIDQNIFHICTVLEMFCSSNRKF